MKKLLVAASFAAVVAFAGAIAWQVNAGTPAASVPAAGLYTPIHPATCGGPGTLLRTTPPLSLRAGRPAVLVRALLRQDVKALAFPIRLV